MGQPARHFLGHDLGPETHLRSTTHSVDDAGPVGQGRYTIHTEFLPARAGLTWTAGARANGVDYNYLAHRLPTAIQEEQDYGLSVELLAIGADFVYDQDRLTAALRPRQKVAH
jgi:hypothetical protein